jgi:hypothetical protein
MKKFSDFVNEAKQTREEEIVFNAIGGGLKPATISLDATRNEDKIGKVKLEFFSKGPRTYNYFPTPEMLAQLSKTTGVLPTGEEAAGNATNSLEDHLKTAQENLNKDLLAVFAKADEDIKIVLKKHNIKSDDEL